MNMQSEIAVELSSNTIAYAEFGDLVLSKLYPRQDTTQEEIGMLASSIETCGLINPLSVLETEDGKCEVVAGGRRLRAIEMLVRAKRWDGGVPVIIAKDAEQARLWANTENTARADLHPADEIREFCRKYFCGLKASSRWTQLRCEGCKLLEWGGACLIKLTLADHMRCFDPSQCGSG